LDEKATNSEINKINDELKKKMKSKGLLEEGGPHGLWDPLNVQKELTHKGFLSSDAGNIASDAGNIERTRLEGGTTAYERIRAQRAFIYVELPHVHSESEKVRKALERELGRSPEASIIEAISICDKIIIFELFMRCSQTIFINRLNRLIEKCISKHRLSKYTLSVFDYYEEPIKITKPGIAQSPTITTAA
jgi:hypothetical protein